MPSTGHRILWAVECLVIVASIVWAFFDPVAGGRVYSILAIAAGVSFVLFQFFWRPRQLPEGAHQLEFEADELKVLRKYHFWFKFPAIAITVCSIASLLQMTAMIALPWFLYQSQWLAVVPGAFVFVTGPYFRHRFDPRNYLNMLATKCPDMFRDDLEVMDRTIAKLLENTGTALARAMAKIAQT